MNDYDLDFMRGHQSMYTTPNSMNNGGGLWDSFSNGIGNSFSTDALGTISGIGNLAGGLYGLYQNNQMMGMYEDQLDIKKEQWAESLKELNHMRDTRKRISSDYMSGSAIKR